MTAFSGEHRGTGAGGPRDRPLHRRLRFLLTPRWIILIVAVMCFVLACYLFLAPWQFQRSAEKDAQDAQLAAAMKAAPVPVSQLLSTDSPPPEDTIWHRATATGTFDPTGQAYIRLRQDNEGRPAYEVVAPFVTDDGATVLVDRGYVPFVAVQRGAALPALPDGTVTITGRVQADQVDPKHRPAATAPDGRLEYTAAASSIIDSAEAGPVYRGYLQLTGDSPGVIEAIALPDDSGERPYFSYAIQWLSFGAIAVFGIGYFIYKELQDPVAENIYLEDPAPRAVSANESRGGDDDVRRQASSTDEPVIVGDENPAAGTTRGAPMAARHGRRSRKSRFDKSELYDDA